MRNGHLLFSAVQFLFLTALFGLGALFFGFHFWPEIRKMIAQWILDPGNSFLLLGAVVSFAAFLLGVCFWVMQRGSFVRIEMKKGAFTVSEAVICSTIQQFWRETYPEEKIPSEIYCAGRKIEIIAEEQGQDLENIEKKLGDFLSKQLGYETEYFVTLTKR